MNSVRPLSFLAAGVVAALVHAETRFNNPVPLITGLSDEPAFVHIADFTGDGKNDLLVASETAIKVMAGDGAGSFAAAVTTAVPDAYTVKGAADFDRNGRMDLYLAADARTAFGVMLASGGGAFGALAPTSTLAYTPILAGDFNNDTFVDVATLNIGFPGRIEVYPGNGAGGFGSKTTGNADFNLHDDYATGDFDGDGRLDILVPSSLLWNDGGGAFSSTPLAALQISYTNLTAGDVNSDGVSDIVSVTNDDFTPRRGVVFYGTRNVRSFGGSRSNFDVRGTGVEVHRLTTGAAPVIVASARSSFATITGNANNSLPQPLSTIAQPEPSRFAVGDLDGDGDGDVAFVNETTFDLAYWVRGNADGTMAAGRLVDAIAAGGSSPKFVEVNGDSRPDLVIFNGELNRLSVLFSDGAGSFLPPAHTTLSQSNQSAGFEYPGDLDGDGREELLLWTSGSCCSGGRRWFVLHAQANGTFTTGFEITDMPSDVPVAFGDLTADGKTDILDGSGKIRAGIGNGTFGNAVAYTFPGIHAGARLADLNGDARLDVAYVTNSGLRVYLYNGSFSPAPPSGYTYGQIRFAEMTGDSHTDMIELREGDLFVRAGNGNGTFADAFLLGYATGGLYGQEFGTGDFDGDGDNDVAVGTTVLFNDGSGVLRSAARFRGGFGLDEVLDATGDARPDLIVRGDDAIAILSPLQNGNGSRESATAASSAQNPSYFASPVQISAAVTSTSTVRPFGSVLFTGADQPVLHVGLGATITAAFDFGPTTVMATYSGDEHFASSSGSLQQSAEKAAVTVDVTPSKTPAGPPVTTFVAGETVYFWLYVRPSQTMWWKGGVIPGWAVSASGNIVLKNGATVIGTVSAPGGRVTISDESILPPGTHTITAEYAGDDHYLAGTGTRTITILKRSASMSTTVSPSTVYVGNQVTATVSFAGTSDATGTVTFVLDGSRGDQTLGTVPIANAQASISFPVTEWGGVVVRANYSGDAKYRDRYDTVYVPVHVGNFGSVVPQVRAWYYPQGNQVVVEVSPIYGATYYDIYRGTNIGSMDAWRLYSRGVETDYVSSTPVSTFVYRAVARNSNNVTSAASANEIATVIAFTDDPVTAGTPIKAVHWTEMQQAANAVRAAAALTPVAFTAIAPGTTMNAAHLNEIRDAVTAARTALGLATALATPEGVWRAVNLQELREAVK